MKIVRVYSDKEEDFQTAIKLLTAYVVRKIKEANDEKK